jgi:sn-glycerol 3-phosphate transport system permease protein
MKKDSIWDHLILIFGGLFLLTPIWLVFVSSTHEVSTIMKDGLQWWPGGRFIEVYTLVLTKTGGFSQAITVVSMLKNSMIMGLGFAIGKIVISSMAAYAIVYFRFPMANQMFALIVFTLLLPLEVRIIPSYEVVARLGMLNSYSGLIIPLIASATATFYFRQFFKSIPDELLEAAKLDNAGPIRFFWDILLPLSKTMVAAIFIIMFVVGWNQYLWPLLMTTDEHYYTMVMGIKNLTSVLDDSQYPPYDIAFAMTFLAMLPPILVVVIFQRWFIKGLVQTEK